nr:calcium-transporting ATPase 2, plasma membrane-type-like [Tanacetum cinerariifolium]
MLEFNRSLDYKALGVSRIEDIVGMMGKEYVLWFERGESRGKYAMSARMVEMRQKLYLKHEVQELLIRHGGEIEFNSFEDSYKDHFNEKLAYDYYGLTRGLEELCEILEDILVVEVANPSRKTSTGDGLSIEGLRCRQELFGINKFAETAQKSFWVIATEGWSKGAHDGLGIATSTLLVVFVTATSYYRQSLQFKGLDKEKKKISIQVTRNAFRKKLLMYELLVGDIVHLAIGDQVPADGFFILGFALSNSTVYITAMVSPSLESYSFKNIQGKKIIYS